MSKGKEENVAKEVLTYLVKQNRPYSAIDIVNNLHKAHGKTAVIKALDHLTQISAVREKTYGKQKVYVADQSQYPGVPEAEIKSMDTSITKVTDELKQLQATIKEKEKELHDLTSSLTTQEATDQLTNLATEIEHLKDKLSKLSEGQVLISKEEKEKLYADRRATIKEWRKRKRLANDILDTILEGYPKSKKQLYEEIGIETDEECKVTMPQI